MKKLFYNLFFLAALALLFASCKKEETNVYYEGGTAPVLTANLSDTIPLIAVDSLSQAVLFSWTNPNYQFSDGISSLNVTYNIEIDTLGANFSSPNKQSFQVSEALSQSFTVTVLNSLLANGLGLALSMPHHIQVRLKSFINNVTSSGALALYSDTINFVVTPYSPPPLLAPPSTYADNPSGNLYIVGAAVSNWDNPIDPGNLAAQTFTEVSTTEYKITIALIGGAEYKLIGVSGSWNDQWSVATADTEPNGGPFVFNGNNCIAPAASGTYTIDVNFQTGKFTVTQ